MVKSRVKIPWFESAAIAECLLCPNSEEIFLEDNSYVALRTKACGKQNISKYLNIVRTNDELWQVSTLLITK